MANDEQTRTVAVVTFFYKGEYLSSLVFDDTETGDAAIATLQEMDAWKEGFVRPQGTILKLMRIIEAMKSN